MPGKNEFPVGGIFRPKTDYEDQFPLNKAERTELQKNTSRALNELHTQMKGNYEKNTIIGTVKTFDTGYGLRIRDNEGNKIGTAYKGEEVRIIGRQNNVRDSDGIKRNFLKIGVYNNRGKIDEKRSGWVAEDFVEVDPKHIDGLLKNLGEKVENQKPVNTGSVVPPKKPETKQGSVLPEKPQRAKNTSVPPPKSENNKKGSVLPPKKTEVPKGSVPPKESKQDTAEITQASLETWKDTIEKNTGIEWIGTTTDISPDLNINGKKVAALISLKFDGMTGLYIIDDGKIYNQSPATKVFYISKKIKIAGGKIVKIPVKNTTKTQVPQATPEKSREIDAYRIEGDDTIQSIAQRYGMSENELRKLNKLDPGEVAKSGDDLLVWINPGYPLPKTTPEKSTPNNRPMGGESPSDKRRMGEASFSPLDVRVPIPEKTAPTLGFGDLHVREKVEQKVAEQKVAELEVKNKKNIDTLIGIADDQIKQGKYSEARANLIKILAMDTNNASDHYMYMVGQTYFYENKFDDAIRCFKHVLTLSPSYYRVHNFLGIIAHKKGDMPLAEEELKKASEMNPKDGTVDYNLAILYVSLKTPKTELAKKYYSDALKKGVEPDAQLQKVLDNISKTPTPKPIQTLEGKQDTVQPKPAEKKLEKEEKKSVEVYESIAKKINEAKTAADAQKITEDIFINGNILLGSEDWAIINSKLINYKLTFSYQNGPQIEEKKLPETSKPKEEPKTATPEKETPPKKNEKKAEKNEEKKEDTKEIKEVRNSLGTKLEWTTIEMLKVMSPNARTAYERMIGRARDQESNFIIADKPRGMFYLFNKLGQSLVRIPALYGEQKGDEIPLSAYTKDDPLEKSRNEKVSPAGIFILGPVYHNDYLKMDAVNVQEDWDDDGMVDEEGSMALHPLYLEHPWENRRERIESDTPTDNKVSYGCLNIRQEDFDEWIRPCFGQGGLIAITPDKQKLIDKYIPPYTPTGGTIASSEK